jgi:type VI protein secretion system component VasF
MYAIFVTICGLVILLGFEIRYRVIAEELSKLRTNTNKLDEEIIRLKAEMKMKQNIYEDYKPPA